MDNVTYSVYMLLEEIHHTCFTAEILLFETALCGFFFIDMGSIGLLVIYSYVQLLASEYWNICYVCNICYIEISSHIYLL